MGIRHASSEASRAPTAPPPTHQNAGVNQRTYQRRSDRRRTHFSGTTQERLNWVTGRREWGTATARHTRHMKVDLGPTTARHTAGGAAYISHRHKLHDPGEQKHPGPTDCKSHVETIRHNHGPLLRWEEEQRRSGTQNIRNSVGTAHRCLRKGTSRTSGVQKTSLI